MATAQQLVADKGEPVAALAPNASVLDAARLMNDRHIGSVLVIDGTRLAGIFTERDVMRRVVAEQRSPSRTAVSEVMTREVAVAAPHTTLDEIRTVIRERRIRHIPVVDDDRVVGMISIGDLNRAEHDGQERTIQYLELYMSVS